jgi:hypothetical protein
VAFAVASKSRNAVLVAVLVEDRGAAVPAEDGMTSAQICVGIDVSNAQLDVALRPEERFAASNRPGVRKSSHA